MGFSEFSFSKIVVFAIAACTIFTSCSNASDKGELKIQKSPGLIDDFLSEKSLLHASIGILAVDSKTGEIVAEHNSGQSLTPASTQKLLVSVAALETFGPDYTFETILAYDGKLDAKGTLTGNVLIRGGGDPALESERFRDHYGDVIQKFQKATADAGIKKIVGKVIGDASFFGPLQIPDTWIWEDIGNYYGSVAGGLNIYENTYQVNFSSKKPGNPATLINTSPALPWISFENMVKSGYDNRDNAYIFGSYLSEKKEIRGTIPANRQKFTIKGAIPDPAYLAAFQLTEKLIQSGITVSGKPESVFQKPNLKDPKTILKIESHPLSEIIFFLNMNSINLYAETLLLHLAKENKENTDVENACAVLSSFWKKEGMDTEGLFIEDGSGLSRANALSADHLSFLLRHMKNQSKYAEIFIKSLPVAGVSGSLKSFGKKTTFEGKFTAKSGYMSRVMSYAGYLETTSGKELVVVVLVNNFTCPNAEMRTLLEELISKFSEN